MQNVLLVLLCITLAFQAKAQACQEVIFTDTTEIIQINLYRLRCRNNHLFQNGLGVILLYPYQKEGEKYFRFAFSLDDTCLDKNPSKYGYVNGKLILIYDADSEGQLIKQTSVNQETQACIRKITEGWVYINPPSERWYNDQVNGVTKRVKENRNLGREYFGQNERIVRFKKDGTVEILHGK